MSGVMLAAVSFIVLYLLHVPLPINIVLGIALGYLSFAVGAAIERPR